MSKETVMSAIRSKLEERALDVFLMELNRLDEEIRLIPTIRARSRTACERIRDRREHGERVDYIVSLELKLKSDFRKYISDLKECKNVWSGYPKFEIK